MPPRSPLHSAALAFARRGIPVFPCKARGKEPITKRGCLDATTDLATINSWWSGWPDQNIGLATGLRSQIAVVDIDGERGEATLGNLEAKHGKLPPTAEAITGKGRHLYFRINASFPTSAGRLGAGIDTRGEGGYIIAPPSIHPSGRKYCWSVGPARRLAPMSEWVIRLIQEARKGKGRTLQAWHGVLTEPIVNGSRNATLTSIAGKLLAHNLGPVLSADLLACVNAARCDPPLDPVEVHQIITSVARRHGRRLKA